VHLLRSYPSSKTIQYFWQMDNYQIADSFSLLAKLLDIHGENSFKSKSYASAAFTIEKLSLQLSEIPVEKISTIKGIGASSSQKIIELLQTGRLKILDDIILNTPPGVVEMLHIKGIGPKKINTIWKEMEIESIGELLYACKENRLKIYKGFGDKTQQSVSDNIAFYLKSKGSFLYSQVHVIAPTILNLLEQLFVSVRVALSGHFKRQSEVINELEFVIEADVNTIENELQNFEGFSLIEKEKEVLLFNSSAGIKIKIHAANADNFIHTLVCTSSSEEFNASLQEQYTQAATQNATTEEGYFAGIGLGMIPASLRENAGIIERATNKVLPTLIQPADIRGIIHCHSNWSDGSNTIEEMATAAINRGLEYMVISDHSKSAFYAQGLNEQKIKEQHHYIDELNKKLFPFKIFKSIESDILNDGSLDYANDVLATFDLVIASVHSNLKMTQDKAMMRLLRAIENPYTTILGHMTGRLLLSRPGYPVDHNTIIDACISNDVVIELNAHPNRLDIDWRHIQSAIEKNALISIDPDAHYTDGLDDTRYGVLIAQKALVTKENNLSSYSLAAFEAFIAARKTRKNI
jgi:DNA polymerase (family X)